MSTKKAHPERTAEIMVKIPMMPKGVEHYERIGEYRKDAEVVKIPMMPKGVEHNIVLDTLARANGSEDSNDAERR